MNEDLTSKIIKAPYEVHNELGPGFLEQIYQNALKIVFEQYELRCEFEKKVEVSFRDQPIGSYYADVIVEDEVELELKGSEEIMSGTLSTAHKLLESGQIQNWTHRQFWSSKDRIQKTLFLKFPLREAILSRQRRIK